MFGGIKDLWIDEVDPGMVDRKAELCGFESQLFSFCGRCSISSENNFRLIML